MLTISGTNKDILNLIDVVEKTTGDNLGRFKAMVTGWSLTVAEGSKLVKHLPNGEDLEIDLTING